MRIVLRRSFWASIILVTFDFIGGKLIQVNLPTKLSLKALFTFFAHEIRNFLLKKMLRIFCSTINLLN